MSDFVHIELPEQKIECLELEVERLRKEMDALIRILWDQRGLAKSLSGRIEKELEVSFKDYLERQKAV